LGADVPKGTSFTLQDVLADECCAPDCDRVAEPEYPTPLCAHHIVGVIRRYQQQLETMQRVHPGLTERLVSRQEAEVCKPRRKPSHVVYFLRFGDRVKIGTSGNLEQRLQVVPHDEVIGTIPGDVTMEREWHDRWAKLRLVGEWFQAVPELLAAIHQAIAEAA
jgi:hypothetical protein